MECQLPQIEVQEMMLDNLSRNKTENNCLYTKFKKESHDDQDNVQIETKRE